MSNEAFVTLATNDTYGLGALVLGRSLRRVATSKQTVVLVTADVSQKMKEELGNVFNLVVTVDTLDSGDAAHLALMSRPELGITFTKLHAWRLVQFSKCVFLDADTLVVQNCDELFEREELSAAPDPGWPDCFNSGVFVFVPSEATFKALLDFAVAHGSFDGGDQGLLNMFFSDWATGDIRKHLPFIYNVVSSATYSYLPALKHFGSQVKIAHFLGSNKPWLRQGQVGTSSPYQRAWWSIFREDVAGRLSQDMIVARPLTVSSSNPILLPRYRFKDPWDFVRVEKPGSQQQQGAQLAGPHHPSPDRHSQASSTREQHSINQIALPTIVVDISHSNRGAVSQESPYLTTPTPTKSHTKNLGYQYHNYKEENSNYPIPSTKTKANSFNNNTKSFDIQLEKKNNSSNNTAKENIGKPIDKHQYSVQSTKFKNEMKVYPIMKNNSTPFHSNRSFSKHAGIGNPQTETNEAGEKSHKRDSDTKNNYKIIKCDNFSKSKPTKNDKIEAVNNQLLDTTKNANDEIRDCPNMDNNPTTFKSNQSLQKSKSREADFMHTSTHNVHTLQTETSGEDKETEGRDSATKSINKIITSNHFSESKPSKNNITDDIIYQCIANKNKTSEEQHEIDKRASATKVDHKIIKTDHYFKRELSKDLTICSKPAHKGKNSEIDKSIAEKTQCSQKKILTSTGKELFSSEKLISDFAKEKKCLETPHEHQVAQINNENVCSISRLGARTMGSETYDHKDKLSDTSLDNDVNPNIIIQRNPHRLTSDENPMHKNAGIPGVLARGEPDDWRREAWEAGDVDYLGRDSFDNIWKRICECVGITAQTLSAPAAPAATSAGIVNQPSLPASVSEKTVISGTEKVSEAAPAEKLSSPLIEKPAGPDAPEKQKVADIPAEKQAEPTVSAEKPAESAVPVEKPAESAVPVVKPAESAVPLEKPAESAVPIEKPAESAVPVEKPAESAVPVEKPAEPPVPAEKSAEPPVPAEKPDPAIVSTEKSVEAAVAAEKLLAPAVSTDKPAEIVVSPEKQAESVVSGEKPAEPPLPTEKHAAPTVPAEKTAEPAVPAEKPAEPVVLPEKPVEAGASPEKKTEPIAPAETQAPPEKPAALPVTEKSSEPAPVAIESQTVVDKEIKVESSAQKTADPTPSEEKSAKQEEQSVNKPALTDEKPVEPVAKSQEKTKNAEELKISAEKSSKEAEAVPTDKKPPESVPEKSVEIPPAGDKPAEKSPESKSETIKPTSADEAIEVCPMKPSEPISTPSGTPANISPQPTSSEPSLKSGEARIQPPLVAGEAPVCKKEPGTPTITPPSGPGSPQPADVPPEVCKLQATPSQPATPPASSHQTTDAPVPPKRKQGKNGKSGKGKK